MDNQSLHGARWCQSRPVSARSAHDHCVRRYPTWCRLEFCRRRRAALRVRIAQVVTYVSPDGSYGGPTSVAFAQSAALARLGHTVTVFAGAPIGEETEEIRDGFSLRLFPAHILQRRLGFAGMRAPELTQALRAELGSFDVLHLHLARDLVTLPVGRLALRRGIPYLAQTHGMIDASTNPLAPLVDRMLTKPILRGAAQVLALTDQEEDDLRGVEPHAAVGRIRNGVRVMTPPPLEGRPPVVLFLARMHERKRPLAFVEMARLVAVEHPEAQFSMWGPDEGQGLAVKRAIADSDLGDRLMWHGPASPDKVPALMASSQVYVLPSVGEVFPMTMLEAFQQGTPTVTTESLGIADKCHELGAALITDGSANQLAIAVGSLLDRGGRADLVREQASAYLGNELNIDDVAAELGDAYLHATERR